MIAYLDNAATTKPCREAVDAITDVMTHCWGNPSSLHSMGMEAEKRLRLARGQVAAALGAEPERVFFTSGGTEADNWAIRAAARRLGKRGKHVVTTAVEHHGVLNPMAWLEEQGFTVTYLRPDAEGVVSARALSEALRQDTILVSCMMVNNETGAVMPVEEMLRTVRRKSPLALFHTDAVQGFGKIPFRAKTLGADLISVSGHKVHGAKGAGALYIRPGLNLPPLLLGGGQEKNLRSGTEPLPAIAAFGAACASMDIPREIDHMAAMRDRCRSLLSEIPGLELIGRGDAPHILTVSLPGLRSQGIINCLQDRGVYVSAGSACSRGHRSHVLEAIGLSPEQIDGSVRISFCRDTTEEELDLLADALRDCRKSLQKT